MIFKNINAYRLDGAVTQASLDDLLGSLPFKSCLPHDERSVGFVPVYGNEQKVFSTSGVHLFCLMVQEKILPVSAVKSYFLAELKRQESRNGKMTGAEKKALRESVRSEMLPKAFTKDTPVWAYIDTKAKLMVVNSSSMKMSEGVAQILRGMVSINSLKPLSAEKSVADAMGLWIRENKAPGLFKLGSKCWISDGEGSISYKKRSLEDKNLQEYLDESMRVTSLTLEFNNESSFSLNEDMMIREFYLNQSDDIDDEIAASLADNLKKMSEHFNNLLNNLLASIDH